MAVALASNNDMNDVAVQDLLNKSVLPMFGLDNESATYPFVDLWGIPHGSFRRIEMLCKLLPPTDADSMQIFKQYRDTAHVIFPGVVDILEFESDLLDFLRHRSSGQLSVQAGSLAEQTVYGKTLHWLGLLFAVLASGFQCSDLPRKERQMKSQVYGTVSSLSYLFKAVGNLGNSLVVYQLIGTLERTQSFRLGKPFFKLGHWLIVEFGLCKHLIAPKELPLSCQY